MVGIPLHSSKTYLLHSILSCQKIFVKIQDLVWYSKAASPSLGSMTDFSTLTTWACLGPWLMSFKNFWRLASSPCASPTTLKGLVHQVPVYWKDMVHISYRTIGWVLDESGQPVALSLLLRESSWWQLVTVCLTGGKQHHCTWKRHPGLCREQCRIFDVTSRAANIGGVAEV